MQFSCNYSRLGDADFCQVTAVMAMWSLSNYFRWVKTTTEKVKLRCGLFVEYASCDGDATLDGVARMMRAYVKLHWTCSLH